MICAIISPRQLSYDSENGCNFLHKLWQLEAKGFPPCAVCHTYCCSRLAILVAKCSFSLIQVQIGATVIKIAFLNLEKTLRPSSRLKITEIG